MTITQRAAISTTICATMFLLSGRAIDAAEPGPVQPLFAGHETLDIRIEAPLTTLVDERPDEEYLPARLSYEHAPGSTRTFDIKLRSRGKYRRQRRVCAFPPIRLNLPTGELDGSLFEGQDKLKLVTHCQTGRSRFEQLVLREYLVYRILQVLTDSSFGVRLMQITYVDTEGGESITRYGFVLEDADDIGARIGYEAVKSDGLSYAVLDPAYTNLVNVFQFLVGNTDFTLIRGPAGEDGFHNSVPFIDGEMIRPIPYDFDFAGLVNAPYAKPNPQFKIRSVRTRLYRGRCSNNVLLDATLGLVNDKKTEIYALVDELRDLDDRNRSQVTDYLDSFFELIADEDQVERKLVRGCA